jgi:hypothetical protein
VIPHPPVSPDWGTRVLVYGTNSNRSLDTVGPNIGCSFSLAVSSPRVTGGSLLAAKQKGEVNNQNDHYRQLKNEAAGLIELVHHESVQLTGGAQFLIH